MDVKPWEPVWGGWTGWERFTWDCSDWKYVADKGAVETWLDPSSEEPRLHVTLANNQRIIVRALSEDRKAARAARKAELAPWIALGQHAAEGLMNELRVKGYCDGDPAFRPSKRLYKKAEQ